MEFYYTLYISFYLLMGLLFFICGLRNYARSKLIANTPTAKIGSVALGLAELRGRIVPRSGMGCPITRQPCLGWKISIGGSKRIPGRIMWEEFYFSFFLEDESGRILVEAKGLQGPESMTQMFMESFSTPSAFSRKGETRLFNLRFPDDKIFWVEEWQMIARDRPNDIFAQVVEWTKERGVDIVTLESHRWVSLVIYKALDKPEAELYVLGTVTAVPEQLAGKTKTEDRVARSDPRDRLLLVSTESPKRTGQAHFQRAVAQLIATALCLLMAVGVFLPLLSLQAVGVSTIALVVGTIILGLLKRQIDPVANLVIAAMFILAIIALWAITMLEGIGRVLR